ncbi:MAG: alpha/beta fold hydrolase [Proteobacteria bacterium]|nr:alpha/beta fold hydrolase [Pseudomonadota bacterium]
MTDAGRVVRVASGTPPGEAAPLTQVASVFMPARLRPPATVLFCLPGGAMNRHYFALRADGAPQEFSFAAHLNARGFIVVALDLLGVGDSGRPQRGFELTPDALVAANARAMNALREQLVAGQFSDRPLSELRSVGVGHSMGAMLTAMQQAQQPAHAGLVLLGFGTGGLTQALAPQELQYAGDPVATRANLVRLARLRGDDPYPPVQRTEEGRQLFAGATADRRGVQALQAARAPLLLTPGLFSMIPGSSAPECARVGVPVLLVVGDRDIAGPPHSIPSSFTGSRDVTLRILPGTGHAHFLFDSRRELFERVAQWCEALVPAA